MEKIQERWIPAFAGMTRGVIGDRGIVAFAGMTSGEWLPYRARIASRYQAVELVIPTIQVCHTRECGWKCRASEVVIPAKAGIQSPILTARSAGFPPSRE